MKGGTMKFLLFIVVLVAVIITAGCIGGKQNSVVTPTPQIVYVTVLVTPTPTSTVARAQDPITGVWRLSDSTGYDNRLRFNADGTFAESLYFIDEKLTRVYYGTWSAQGGNSYALRDTTIGTYETYIYDPARNSIYYTKYPTLLLTPYQGDVMAASSSKSTPTPSATTSSSLKYTGYGDDIKKFSVEGGGGFIITGSNSGGSNFIVHITDNEGKIVEFVFNEIGPYSGKKIVNLDPGKYFLEVQAEGSWSIDISPT